jgi:glutathione S-transferase
LTVKLYSIAISHPARAAGLMLRYKGIEHELVDIPPGTQRLLLRLHGFRGATVPAIKIDGKRVQGSLNISRALDELQPEPPLLPADPQRRVQVEEAERWGEAELQPVPRNIFRWCAAHDYGLRVDLARSVRMPVPPLMARLMKPLTWYFASVVSRASEESVRAEVAALPAQLDHVDELIETGVIGGEQPNAADFQIATSVRVLLNFPPLRPLIESRPAAQLAMKIAPRFGDGVPLKLPPAWLPDPALSAR